jgi:uncharacterized phage infection (PIP) family protein YhgE
MRKTIFWCSLITAALSGSACKKESSEKPGEQVRKSVEEVREQRKDVREAQKDVIEKQKEMMKQQRELTEAQGNLAKARVNYVTAARERLAKLDAKIDELEARGDAKSKDAAITLRARRNALAAELDTAGSRIDAEWDKFRSDLDDTFQKAEKEVKEALE